METLLNIFTGSVLAGVVIATLPLGHNLFKQRGENELALPMAFIKFSIGVLALIRIILMFIPDSLILKAMYIPAIMLLFYSLVKITEIAVKISGFRKYLTWIYEQFSEMISCIIRRAF